jgi:hypothetical protein
MALRFVDIAKMTTITSGQGTLTLLTSVASFKTFEDAGIQTGDTVCYTIESGIDREVGLGTYNAAALTLTRDTVFASTNGDTKIEVRPGSQVAITVAAPYVEMLMGATSVTFTDIATSRFPSVLQFLHVTGYATAGDGGHMRMKKAVSEPSHAAKRQSLDGAWWEIAEFEPNPLQFGAVVGTSNSLTAIQNWLNYGGNLRGAEGTFRVGSGTGVTTLTISNPNTVIRAKGMAIEQYTINRESPVILVDIGADDCAIYGLEIDGDSENKQKATTAHDGCGIQCKASGFTLQDCFIHDTIEDGFNGRRATLDPQATQYGIRILDNIFERTGTPPIMSGEATTIKRGLAIWFLGDFRDVQIRGNKIRDVYFGGIGTDTYSSDATAGRIFGPSIIADNIVNCVGLGIHWESSFEGVIEGNIVDVAYSGFNSTHACLSLRTIEQNSQIQPAGKVTVSGNKLKGTHVGIDARNLEEGVITGNLVEITSLTSQTYSDTKCCMTYIAGDFSGLSLPATVPHPRNLLISGNTFRSNDYGVLVGFEQVGGAIPEIPIQNISITGNIIEHTNIDPADGETEGVAAISNQRGLYVRQHDGLLIKGNEIRGFYVNLFENSDDAAADSQVLIEGNILTDGVLYNAQLDGAGARTLRGNKSSGAGTAGLRLATDANVITTVLSDNEFLDTTAVSFESGSTLVCFQPTYNKGLTPWWAEKTITYAASVAPDFATFQNAVITLTGNITLANGSNLFSSVTGTGYIRFVQDGTGGRTITFGTDYEFTSGAAIVLSTAIDVSDVIGYQVLATGRVLLWVQARQHS